MSEQSKDIVGAEMDAFFGDKANSPEMIKYQDEQLYETAERHEDGDVWDDSASDTKYWEDAPSIDLESPPALTTTLNMPMLTSPGGLTTGGPPAGFTPEQTQAWRDRIVAWEHSTPRYMLEVLRAGGAGIMSIPENLYRLPGELYEDIKLHITDPEAWSKESRMQTWAHDLGVEKEVGDYLLAKKEGQTPTREQQSAWTQLTTQAQHQLTQNLAGVTAQVLVFGGLSKWGGKAIKQLKPKTTIVGKISKEPAPPVRGVGEAGTSEIIIPGEVIPTKSTPKIEIVSHYKQPIPFEVAKASKSWTEGRYKVDVLAEIDKLPNLPELSKSVVGWKPPIFEYQNAYTRTMYKVWDGWMNFVDRKFPAFIKTHYNKQIAELTLETQRVIDGLNASVKTDIIKPLGKLDPEMKAQIGLMVNKHLPVPDQLRPQILEIDARIGQLGRPYWNKYGEWLENDLIKPDEFRFTQETWLSGLGEYARRRYLQPNVVEGKPPRIVPQRGTTEKIIKQSMFKKRLTDYEWGERALSFEGRSAKEITQMPKAEVETLGRETMKKAGWDFQADSMLDWTFKDLHQNYATMLWMDNIVKMPELFSRTPKPGYISLQEAGILPKGTKRDFRLGPLNEGYIHPGLKREIKSLVQFGENRAYRFFNHALGWWKAGKVAMSPKTIVRNHLSGALFQNDMAGYPVWYPQNAAIYAGAVTQYLTKGPRWDFWQRKGLYGADYYSVEISEAFLKRLPDDQYAYLTVGDKLANLSEKGRKVFRYYGAIDHLQRTYLAECATRHGASPAQAVHLANKWQLDYRFVSSAVNMSRKPPVGFALPFVSFPALMMPRIAEVMVTRPWVLAKYPVLFSVINSYNRNRLGLDEETLEAAKPDFLKNDPYAIVIGKDENNQPIFWSASFTIPFGGWQTGFQDVEQWGNTVRSGGLVGSAFALVTGYDPFMKTQIYKETDPKSIQQKKMFEYALRAYGPGVASDVVNVWKAANGYEAGWPNRTPKSLKQALLKAVGVNIYSGGENAIEIKTFLALQKLDNLEDSIDRISDNPNYSREYKEQLKQEINDEIDKTELELNKLDKALIKLNIKLPFIKPKKAILSPDLSGQVKSEEKTTEEDMERFFQDLDRQKLEKATK